MFMCYYSICFQMSHNYLVLLHLVHLDFHFQHQIFSDFLHVLNPVSREGCVRQKNMANTLT